MELYEKKFPHWLLTGQPFGLFHNKDVLSRGIIGVAFTADSSDIFENQLFKLNMSSWNLMEQILLKLLLDSLQSGDDKEILSKETGFYLVLYNSDDDVFYLMLLYTFVSRNLL